MSSECTCITNLQSINEYLQEQEDNNEQEQLDDEDIEEGDSSKEAKQIKC